MSDNIKEQILELRRIINRHDYLYNVKDNPEISDYLDRIEQLRSDAAKQERRLADHEVIELHNNA